MGKVELGLLVGIRDGLFEGYIDDRCVGFDDGDVVGRIGAFVGVGEDGAVVGVRVFGAIVGVTEGFWVGFCVGRLLDVGDNAGKLDGDAVGANVGTAVGDTIGMGEGLAVGLTVGF